LPLSFSRQQEDEKKAIFVGLKESIDYFFEKRVHSSLVVVCVCGAAVRGIDNLA